MVTSSYDIAAMILTPLISYIGGSRKKPVFCAWGVFTMGVGFFIFMLPHFVSPPYEVGMSMPISVPVSVKLQWHYHLIFIANFSDYYQLLPVNARSNANRNVNFTTYASSNNNSIPVPIRMPTPELKKFCVSSIY